MWWRATTLYEHVSQTTNSDLDYTSTYITNQTHTHSTVYTVRAYPMTEPSLMMLMGCRT